MGDIMRLKRSDKHSDKVVPLFELREISSSPYANIRKRDCATTTLGNLEKAVMFAVSEGFVPEKVGIYESTGGLLLSEFRSINDLLNPDNKKKPGTPNYGSKTRVELRASLKGEKREYRTGICIEGGNINFYEDRLYLLTDKSDHQARKFLEDFDYILATGKHPKKKTSFDRMFFRIKSYFNPLHRTTKYLNIYF
ncbi:MAG TPA: hypothetical protein VI894_02605 [Candidatus Nanoarchaeia archaeon]|nr:hypothetical protein [Candidatus Nanoarchaeia archaeon]